jgi:hypothetical protein
MKKKICETAVFIAFILSCHEVKTPVLITRDPANHTNYSDKIKIVVPDFSDSEFNKYHNEYAANFIEFVKAVRQNDTAKAWAAMEKDYQFYLWRLRINEAFNSHPERLQPADQQKEIFFQSQVKPLYNEIKNSEYIKEEIRRIKDSRK